MVRESLTLYIEASLSVTFFQGQPVIDYYDPQPTVELQFPPEYHFVPGLAKYVKLLAILDILYVGLYLILGVLYMILVLPLPIAGYLGAARYNHVYLVWYLVYLVVMANIRIFILCTYTLDSFTTIFFIISLISNGISLGATAKLYSALSKLNSQATYPSGQ
jgi:hypothetical protein